ncbi:MAG: triose-phosphate isomerase [Betaproteobacteria bacterium]
MRNRFVIGNWKLNGSLSFNAGLLNSLVSGVLPTDGKFCGVCVPAPYLAQAGALMNGSALGWGAQDVSRFESGAYTGDVAAGMVAEFGSRYAIVGHSERRAVFGDTDAAVAEKFGRAKKAGLTPILCIGESLAERESNQTEAVVSRQLKSIVDLHGIALLQGAIVAYEPVWAIGTGRTASPDQAEEVHAFLRGLVKHWDARVADTLPILYGGSVKKSNAAELFAMPDVDGGLIGGASLIADEFLGIWNAL